MDEHYPLLKDSLKFIFYFYKIHKILKIILFYVYLRNKIHIEFYLKKKYRKITKM